MNIIKFKDTIVKDQDWYNDNLRGRYAYWVRCRYVIPLDSITQNMYVSFETTINNLLGYVYYGLTENSGVYSYVNVPWTDLSEKQQADAVLVEEVPENPTEDSPILIKLDHHVIKYADLWKGDYYWMNTYIDNTETDLVNSVDIFKSYNSYVPSVDIDPEELKHFRTWLAESILSLNYTFYELVASEEEEGVDPTYSYVKLVQPSLAQLEAAVEVDVLPEIGVYDYYKLVEDEGEYKYALLKNPTDAEEAAAEEKPSVPTDPTSESPEYIKVKVETPEYIKIKDLHITDYNEDTIHMLQYYAGGMYDDTLKWISAFSGVDVTAKFGVPSGACGCGGGSNISSLYNDSVSVCDTVSIYRKGIKNTMVSLFSSIDTWTSMCSTFILKIKEYIDGIIQANYGMSVSDQSNYYSCECLNRSGQDSALAILKQLSTAFEYIAKKDINTHKNFIVTVLGQWSNQLYELMEWN